MFKLFVTASTFQELRIKLLEAAHSINVVENEEELVEPTPAMKRQRKPKVQTPVIEETRDDGLHASGDAVIIEDEVPFDFGAMSAPEVQETNGDVDSRGIPWDTRIHSATKAKNKDGSWRYRRGVDDNLVKEIEGGFRTAANNSVASQAPAIPIPPSTPVAPVVPPVPPGPVVTMPVFQQPVPVPPPVSQPAPAPTAAPAPVAQAQYENIPVPAASTKPAHTFETFRSNLITVLSGLVLNGSINQPYIEDLKKYFGVPEIWKLSDEQARELFEQFVNAGLITKVG